MWKRKPLKKRTTPAQQFSRREKMMKQGTFRQETGRTLAQLTGQNKAAFQGLGMIFGKLRITRWLVYGILGERVGYYAYLGARYLGYL